MNTATLKAPQTLDTDTKVVQHNILAGIEASWKAFRKFPWTLLSTPAYSDQLLRDKNLGAEFRRMKW